MSYSATVTLGSSYTGNTNIDNFTIQAIGSDYTTVRTTYATGVTRAALAAGYGISGVEATDTYVRVTSSGTCINSVDFPINAVATPTPTPTSGATPFSVSYSVGGNSGGQLIVKSFQNVELLDITSTFGSTQSGTIQLTTAQTPYTIIARWVAAGSGDPVKMRVCDTYSGGSELYYVDDLCPSCAGGEEATYVSNAGGGTPYDMQINLVKGISNAPAICAL